MQFCSSNLARAEVDRKMMTAGRAIPVRGPESCPAACAATPCLERRRRCERDGMRGADNAHLEHWNGGGRRFRHAAWQNFGTFCRPHCLQRTHTASRDAVRDNQTAPASGAQQGNCINLSQRCRPPPAEGERFIALWRAVLLVGDSLACCEAFLASRRRIRRSSHCRWRASVTPNAGGTLNYSP
jgi:hypothetical protein